MKQRPPDFPDDVYIPMGITWSPHNRWTVRRRKNGILSTPAYFGTFEEALAYRKELFADDLDYNPEEDKRRQYIAVRNRLSLENIHLLTIEQLEEKIELYRSRLNRLWKEHHKRVRQENGL